MKLSKKVTTYFKAADAVSKLSDHRCQVGCVIVDSHRIISSGYNSKTRTHAFQAKLDKKYFGCECVGLLHAEVDALIPLINSRQDLSHAVVYVSRKNRNGEPALARPCPRCMSVIKSCGIKEVRYSTPDGYASELVTEGTV